MKVELKTRAALAAAKRERRDVMVQQDPEVGSEHSLFIGKVVGFGYRYHPDTGAVHDRWAYIKGKCPCDECDADPAHEKEYDIQLDKTEPLLTDPDLKVYLI